LEKIRPAARFATFDGKQAKRAAKIADVAVVRL
jgi:hypothetical protein